jgi:hypothetical protein
MMKRISEDMRLEVHRLLSKPQKIELKHSMILEEVKKRLWIVGPPHSRNKKKLMSS